MPTPFQRHLTVEGTFNFRDVGHYAARDGRSTRAAVLYRSGAIHDLRPVGELGIRTVVDLRGDAEVGRDGGPLGAIREHPGVRRVAAPLIPAQVGEKSGSEYLNGRFGHGISAGRYRGYLEIAERNLRDVFRLFESPDAFPSVVHCTAGKDRTGVVVALVLDLLGVDHETIVADYEMSNAAMPDLVAHLRGEPAEPTELSESDLALFSAPREAMAGFLAHVRSEHGSARGLLISIGVEERVLATLEEVLLTRA